MANLKKNRTRLKCKSCKKFYEDDGREFCECGTELIRINVHNIKPEGIISGIKTTMKGAK